MRKITFSTTTADIGCTATATRQNKFSSGFKFLSILLLVLLVSGKSWGQILTEDFSYSTAGNITTASGGNWSAHSGTTFYPQYTNSGLTFSGHAGSSIGGALSISSTGVADVNRTFTSQNSGTVYMSCLVNFSAALVKLYFSCASSLSDNIVALSATLLKVAIALYESF